MIILLSDSFTRPDNTTAYANTDLVANSETAGSVVPLTWENLNLSHGPISINRVRLQKSGTTATNAQFRLHLFAASPTVANGDNSTLSASESANYLGSVDGTMIAFSDGCAVSSSLSVPIYVDFPGPTTTVYGLLEALAAYTPAAEEVFTVSLTVNRLQP